MLGFIKKLLGVLVSIITFPLTLLPGSKGKSAGAKVAQSTTDAVAAGADAVKSATDAVVAGAETAQAKANAFFIEEADAAPATPKSKKRKPKSKKSATPKDEPAVPTAASALNLPQPTVTTTTAEVLPANNYKQFASRRRPGANMKSYLDMAKNIKNA